MKWKNIPGDTHTFFITGTIAGWHPLLEQAEARRILLADFDFYRGKYGCRVAAYVLMPEHYHLILDVNQPTHLHEWLRDAHSHSAHELARWLVTAKDENELRRYRDMPHGNAKLAVWKEQARAVGIITQRVLRVKIEYIHANPVRRGLVASPGEWPWSSWRSYYLGDNSPFRVDRFEATLG